MADIRTRLYEVLFVGVLILVATAVIYLDVIVFDSKMSETSLTQIYQGVLLLLCFFLFLLAANRSEQHKGYCSAWAVLFLWMFIRESDGLLDSIKHGFWVYPATFVALLGALFLVGQRNAIGASASVHMKHPSFWVLLLGMSELVFFSRLFGSGLLWDHVIDGDTGSLVKAVVQEGTELISYTFIVIGAAFATKSELSDRNWPVRNATVPSDRRILEQGAPRNPAE
ncbi:MAG: hypothetical protein AAGA38_08750 [Pseudomonadota bacterium]